MNNNFRYVQSTYEEALSNSKKAGDYINSALSSGNSVKGLEVSGDIASSFNTALTKVKELSEKISKIPGVFENWSDKIIQLNLNQMSASDPTGFYYVIKNIGDGYYKVFGLGGPMIVNAEGAKYLQEAINKMLSVCPGTYGNNGAKVGDKETSAHSVGKAFDMQTNLGLRINFNGGGDVAYYAVNNKKTAISSYDVFYVTYDGELEDIFNNQKLTIKKAYLKIRPGTTIPTDMKKYIVSGLDNVIEVDDVERSTPSLNNMHYTSFNDQFLDVSKLFYDYGWKQIGAYGDDTGKYQSIEWHHFQYYPELVKESGVYVPDPDGSGSDEEIDITFDYDLGEYDETESLDVLNGDNEEFIDVSEDDEVIEQPDNNNNNNDTSVDNGNTTPNNGNITPDNGNTTPDTEEPIPDDTPVDDGGTVTPNTTPIETIWLDNGYSDLIPIIDFGTNGTIYLNESENLVYGVNSVTLDIYNSYIESLKVKGYVLNDKGIWTSEHYNVSINYLEDQMVVSIFKNVA